MSAEAVQTEILEPMQRLFLPPRQMTKDEQIGALRDYLAALQGFDAQDLHDAWIRVRDTHANRSWPVPSIFVVAARQARKDRLPDAQPARMAERQASENERWERWKAVCRAPIAYEAVKRQVAWSLRCAILNDGKEIHQISLQELVSKKRSAELTAQAIERGEPVFKDGRHIEIGEEIAAKAMAMWKTLMQRESETANEIARLAA